MNTRQRRKESEEDIWNTVRQNLFPDIVRIILKEVVLTLIMEENAISSKYDGTPINCFSQMETYDYDDDD